MKSVRNALIWCALAVALAAPTLAAITSPLLEWRRPIYIAAGFAGILGMTLLLVQPLLVGGYLPGLAGQRGKRAHRWIGVVLIAAIMLHVGGLWITSPPDVVDALLFVSPTPFSPWGVTAMWAIFGAALLAAFRRRLRMRLVVWRRGHTALVGIGIVGSVVHALLIEGTMEPATKAALCLLVAVAATKVMLDLSVWSNR